MSFPFTVARAAPVFHRLPEHHGGADPSGDAGGGAARDRQPPSGRCGGARTGDRAGSPARAARPARAGPRARPRARPDRSRAVDEREADRGTVGPPGDGERRPRIGVEREVVDREAGLQDVTELGDDRREVGEPLQVQDPTGELGALPQRGPELRRSSHDRRSRRWASTRPSSSRGRRESSRASSAMAWVRAPATLLLPVPACPGCGPRARTGRRG